MSTTTTTTTAITDTPEVAPIPYATPADPVAPRPQRLTSLDVFRGLTIALMVLVNNPMDWGQQYKPLEHAAWHGWTLTDLVFPFFLFIVGVAIPFAFGKRLSDPSVSRKTLAAHIWLRALTLVMLGWILHAMPGQWRELPAEGYYTVKILRVIGVVFTYTALLALLIPWPWKRAQIWVPIGVTVVWVLLLIINHYALAAARQWTPDLRMGGGLLNPDFIRIPGVLQRIGLCYGVAGTIALFGGWRTVLLSTVLFLAIYSVMMLKMPFKDHVTGSLEKNDNLARKMDEAVFDRWTIGEDGRRKYTQRHTYSYPDPEGLLSTIPSISTALLGVLVGLWLRTSRPAMDRAAALFAAGFATALLGVGLDWWLMPINKQIWTPSFVVLTAGLGMLTLALMFWVIDVHGWRRWSWPFAVMGMYAIFIYAVAETFSYFTGFLRIPFRGEKVAPLDAIEKFWSGLTLSKPMQSLLYSLSIVLIMLLIAILLHACVVLTRTAMRRTRAA